MGRGGEGAIAPTPKRRIFELLCHASDSLSLFLPLPLSPPPPSFELFVENETALPTGRQKPGFLPFLSAVTRILEKNPVSWVLGFNA